MKDFFGREILVGDRVVYAQRFASELILVLGEVAAITPANGQPRKIKVRRLRENDREMSGETFAYIRHSERLVVVPGVCSKCAHWCPDSDRSDLVGECRIGWSPCGHFMPKREG